MTPLLVALVLIISGNVMPTAAVVPDWAHCKYVFCTPETRVKVALTVRTQVLVTAVSAVVVGMAKQAEPQLTSVTVGALYIVTG